VRRRPPGGLVGSLATASINRTLSKALISLAPPELEFAEIPIKDLPLYSYDYDVDYPAEGRALKDAIDWASRPPREPIRSRASPPR
jgi:chromate reductase